MEAASALPEPYRLHSYDVVDSTNLQAHRMVAEGALPLTPHEVAVITAAKQTAGRGRRDRAWVSPPGNLHVSLCFAVDITRKDLATLACVAGLSMMQSVQAMDIPTLGLKWPNDILLNGQKLGGVLLELRHNPRPNPTSEAGWYLVLGLGINVLDAPPEETVAFPATSLAKQGHSIEAEDVLHHWLHRWQEAYDTWQAEGFTPFYDAWRAAITHLGKEIAYHDAEGHRIHGRALDVQEDGSLLLAHETGHKIVTMGDVFPITQGER